MSLKASFTKCSHQKLNRASPKFSWYLIISSGVSNSSDPATNTYDIDGKLYKRESERIYIKTYYANLGYNLIEQLLECCDLSIIKCLTRLRVDKVSADHNKCRSLRVQKFNRFEERFRFCFPRWASLVISFSQGGCLAKLGSRQLIQKRARRKMTSDEVKYICAISYFHQPVWTRNCRSIDFADSV